MARLLGPGLVRSGVALVALAALVAFAFLAYVRPDGSGGEATRTPADTPTTTRAEPRPTPTIESEIVAFTNPDGPSPDVDQSDEFLILANALPTFAQVWMDENQRDYHIALTADIDGAIQAIGHAVPRGITVYFHIAEHTRAELCALRDAVFADRVGLLEHGIILSSGGCGNMENRVILGISPLTPETLAFMRTRYEGPIDYEDGGVSALRQVEPPQVDEVRLMAARDEEGTGLATCGRRPFPSGSPAGVPVDLDTPGPEFAALREDLDIYRDIYGELAALGWILVERDEYGATFIADRGDTWLEAPVYASAGGWVPGTIDYCDPRPLSPEDGGSATIYLNPAFPAPDAASTQIRVLVEERECSSGTSPADRLLPPIARYGEQSLSLTVLVRPVDGGAECPGNPRLPVTIVLPEPLGDRALRGVRTTPTH